MSIFHQHNHPTSKYCSSVILPPLLELGCLRWGIGASSTRYRINMSTKQLLKRHYYFYNGLVVSFKSHYKVKATFAAMFYNLSLFHYSHVAYSTHLETTYQSSQFVCQHLFFSSFLHFCLRLPAQISGPYSSHKKIPLWPQNLKPHTRPGAEY